MVGARQDWLRASTNRVLRVSALPETRVGETVLVQKIKRPAGTFCFALRFLVEDEFGTWLFGPIGSLWTAPHDNGALTSRVVILLSEGRELVGWWFDDPSDRQLAVDICLPVTRSPTGWTFVDLELDPVRHEIDGRIEVEDQDEFEDALRHEWMSQRDATTALRVAAQVEKSLRERIEPLGQVGWERLEAACAEG
jgi:hypothetical protein